MQDLRIKLRVAAFAALLLIPLYMASVASAQKVDESPIDALDEQRMALRGLLDAVQMVETGGEADPASAESNKGRDIGWYQISPAYYKDACDSPLGRGIEWPPYREACGSRVWAERLVVAYWSRYAIGRRGADSDEARARIHNGGPTGHRKSSTLRYWRKVMEMMK